MDRGDVIFARMVYIFMLLLATAVSAETILFVDLNNAPTEIKAVSAGRSVDVVPTYQTISKDTRQKIEVYNRNLEKVQGLSSRCFLDNISRDCQHLESTFGLNSSDQYYTYLYDQGVERRRLLAEFKAERLEDEIVSVARSSYETVVISGHHSNGYMSGELVEAFQFDVIKTIVARNPNQFSRVKHLIILGCNSGQKDIIVRWQNVFPSSELVVAAAGIAPIKTDARNLSFIKKLMVQVDSLNEVNSFDPSFFLSQIRTGGWPVAILYKNKNSIYVYKN